MLTKVILDGPMGKQFGREWELEVKSPREALRLINANDSRLFNWMRENAQKYSKYAVVCKVGDRIEEFTEAQYQQQEGQFDEIRFVPIIEGAGNVARIVIGVILIIVDICIWGADGGYLSMMGAALILGGVAGMLAPKPKVNDNSMSAADTKSSYYFDGPANTTSQGVPVQLIYGRCLVGSHTISAAVTVDQLM